jgi:DNA-binding beta-propeller fold protein YncE
VVVVGPDGEEIREIAAPRDAAGGRLETDVGDDPAAVTLAPGAFFGPRAVAVTEDEVYVVDTGNERVQVFGIDGTFRRLWGGYGSEPNRLIEPVGIAIGPDEQVYVADSGNARISIFTPRGDPVAQWPVAAWPPPDPSGVRPGFQPYLAFDEDGLLYATAAESGSVEVFDRNGERVRSIEEVGGDPLEQPVGVDVAPDGSLLVTDLGRDAVFREEPIASSPLTEIVMAPPPGDEGPEEGAGAAPTSGALPRPPG